MARNSGFITGELADTPTQILLALTQPRHGYAIQQFLTQQSQGSTTIGPASLYTTLKKLTTAGYIQEIEDPKDTRRTYILTPEGREILTYNINRRRQFLTMAETILEQS